MVGLSAERTRMARGSTVLLIEWSGSWCRAQLLKAWITLSSG